MDFTERIEAPHRQPVQTQFISPSEAPAGPPEPTSCVFYKPDWAGSEEPVHYFRPAYRQWISSALKTRILLPPEVRPVRVSLMCQLYSLISSQEKVKVLEFNWWPFGSWSIESDQYKGRSLLGWAKMGPTYWMDENKTDLNGRKRCGGRKGRADHIATFTLFQLSLLEAFKNETHFLTWN